MVKTAIWIKTDVEGRKHGEQKGFGTLVVHAVKDECLYLDFFKYIVKIKHSA